MAIATTATKLTPQGGWTQITATGAIAGFVRINKTPEHVPIFIVAGTSAPTGIPQGGFKITKCSTFLNGAIANGTQLYARIQNNSNADVYVFVYQN